MANGCYTMEKVVLMVVLIRITKIYDRNDIVSC